MLAYTFYENDNRVMRYAEALQKRGDAVDVISLRKPGQGRAAVVRGVNVYRIQKRRFDEKKGKLAYLYRLSRFLFRSGVVVSFRHFFKRYNIIHVHSVPDFEVFAALIPRIFGARIILDIHDIVPEFYSSKFAGKTDSSIFRLLVFIEKLSIMFSHHVIIANHIWHKRLVKRSVNEGKCSVIMNYPDPTLFYERERTNRHDKFILLYPGTISHHQGLDIALQAMVTLKSNYPDLEFHVYGDGPDRKNLERMVDEFQMEEVFFIHDIVPIEEVAGIMSSADVGVIPKRGDTFSGEAFSTKSLEFMSLGIPVLMSSTTIDRYYFDKSTVEFFEVGNADDLARKIVGLIQDEAKRNELSMNGRKLAALYSWEKRKNEYFQIIDRLTAR